MTVDAAGKITVGVLDAHLLDDEAIRRLRFGADAVVTFHQGSAPSQVGRFAELLPGVAVSDGGAVGDVREAMIECGRRGVVVLTTPPPGDARRFVARAIQGAAAVADEGGDVIAVQVIRRSVPVDKIAWLTETGEVSGYGVLYAAGFALKMDAEVVLITPTERTRTPRTPAAVEMAKKLQVEHDIVYSVISDPSPIDRVVRNPDGVGVVVHPVLDAPGGRALLHWGELPKSSTASGSPAAVVHLLDGFEGNVVIVFDGTQLLAGAVPLGRRVGTAGVALLMALGVGIGAAAPSMAAGITGTPTAGAQTGSGHATGNTAAIYQDASWATAVSDVIQNLHFTADEHKGGTTALHIVNDSDHEVTVQIVGEHGQASDSQSYNLPHTVAGHGKQDVTAGSGTKQWVTATLTHIDGTPLPEPLVLLQNGHAVTITVEVQEQFVEDNVPSTVLTPQAPAVTVTGQREEMPEGTRDSHTGVGQVAVPNVDGFVPAPLPGHAPVAPQPAEQATPSKVVTPQAPETITGQLPGVPEGTRDSVTGVGQVAVPNEDSFVPAPLPGHAPVAPVPVEQQNPELKPTVTHVVPAPSAVTGGQREDLQPGSQGSFTGGTEVTEHVVGSYGPTVTGGQREDLQPGSQASFTGGTEVTEHVVGSYGPTVTGGQREDLQPGSQGSFTGGTEVTEHVVGSYGPTVAGGQREDLQPGSQGSFVGESPLAVPQPDTAGRDATPVAVPTPDTAGRDSTPVAVPPAAQMQVPQPVPPAGDMQVPVPVPQPDTAGRDSIPVLPEQATEQPSQQSTPQTPATPLVDTVTGDDVTVQTTAAPTSGATEATGVDELAHTGGSAGLGLLSAGLVAGGAGLMAASAKREDDDEGDDEDEPSA